MSSINRFSNDHLLDFRPTAGAYLAPRHRNAGLAQQRNSKVARVAMFAIAFVALGLTCYLSWAALTSSKVAGCGGGGTFDCGHVMQTKWSSVMGIPVGVPAAALYVTLLAGLTTMTLASPESVRSLSKNIVAIGAYSAALAAAWFISLQLFVVEHLCGYCLAAHTCGIVLAALVTWNLRLDSKRTLTLATVSLFGVLGLIAAQVSAEPPKTYQIQPLAAPVEAVQDDGSSLFAAPIVDQSSDNAATDTSVFAAPI